MMSFLISCIDHQFIINEVTIKTWKDPLKGLPDKGPIQFENPEIGQRSYYVHFRASIDRNTNEVRYEYSDDTLALGISGKNTTHWILKEFFTAGSYSFHASDGYNTDSVYVSHLQINTDSISVSRPAILLYSTYFFMLEYDVRQAFTLAPVTDPSEQNKNCSPFFNRSSDRMEYTLDYNQNGKIYDHLNIYSNYSKTEVDGEGMMYAYSSSDGFVRRSAYNPWTDTAGGWDLVPR